MKQATSERTPNLSIVMPVFNHPRELEVMVDSILSNTYGDWELLAVDDGSQSDTIEMLEQYASHDSRVRFVRRNRNPKGAQTCRNIGLDLARGEYVVFFDSDDYVASYCLGRRVEELNAHPEYDFMVFPNGVFVNNCFNEHYGEKQFGYHVYRDDVAAFCSRTLPFVVWNNIYRTKALRSHHLQWDEALKSLQDSDFNLQTLLQGLRYGYAFVPPDYGYRIDGNDNSISKQIVTPAHWESHLYVTEKWYRMIRERYGNKYNLRLYLGVLFLYNLVCMKEIQYDMELGMGEVVCRHVWIHGFFFKLRVLFRHILNHFVPRDISRKIVLVDYLMWWRRNEHRIMSRVASSA